MSVRSTRRGFLAKGAALAGASAAAAVWPAPYVLGQVARSSKLGVAVIGAGGMGGYSAGAARGERFVALVDVDENTIAKVMKGIESKSDGKPKVYYDYRKMLDECHKELDAVLIATPDHNHAPAAIRAINLAPTADRSRTCSTPCATAACPARTSPIRLDRSRPSY